MLYTNEEPLVQRTCIKTASLQSEKLVTRKSVSEKAHSTKAQSEKVQPEELSPAGKIKEHRNEKGYFTAECTDQDACISCAMCAMICPDCAITIQK